MSNYDRDQLWPLCGRPVSALLNWRPNSTLSSSAIIGQSLASNASLKCCEHTVNALLGLLAFNILFIAFATHCKPYSLIKYYNSFITIIIYLMAIQYICICRPLGYISIWLPQFLPFYALFSVIRFCRYFCHIFSLFSKQFSALVSYNQWIDW